MSDMLDSIETLRVGDVSYYRNSMDEILRQAARRMALAIADGSFFKAAPLEIAIPEVTDHRQMVAMDITQPESAGEKAYRLKQQAKQEAEAQKEQAKADQMQQAGEVFSREYGSLNDHRLGYRP